jgi:SAM-dependent methyltransferase
MRLIVARQADCGFPAFGVGSVSVSPDERWLAANWPFVRAWLPAVPARVAEVGCGPLGGFVPMMEAAGYQATGIDPQAPSGPSYRQALFEDCAVPAPLDAIVACTSLHHVADLSAALDLMAQVLVPGGQAVIVEWARERFDEATARWCFARLPAADDDPGWLHRRQAEGKKRSGSHAARAASRVHGCGLGASRLRCGRALLRRGGWEGWAGSPDGTLIAPFVRGRGSDMGPGADAPCCAFAGRRWPVQ